VRRELPAGGYGRNLDEVFVSSPGRNVWSTGGRGYADCSGPEVGKRYLLHLSGNKDFVDGAPRPSHLYGITQPLPECTQPFACRVLAAPDVDRDGADELAIEVGDDGETRSVVFYRLEADPAADRYSLVRMSVAPPGDTEHGLPPGPATFAVGRAAIPPRGVACLGDHNHLRILVVNGVLTDPKHERGDVHQIELRPEGSTLVVLRTRDLHDVQFGVRLHGPGARDSLCGAPIAGP
jgi:hypothetical protein